MSLDVYLTRKRDEPTEADKAIALLRANGFEKFAFDIECRHEYGDVLVYDANIRVYDANITHNLSSMAREAGILDHLWSPEEIGITKAGQLIEPLRKGLELMRSDRERFEKFNSPNGWGLYKNFVPWIENYLAACEENPDADVSVSR